MVVARLMAADLHLAECPLTTEVPGPLFPQRLGRSRAPALDCPETDQRGRHIAIP